MMATGRSATSGADEEPATTEPGGGDFSGSVPWPIETHRGHRSIFFDHAPGLIRTPMSQVSADPGKDLPLAVRVFQTVQGNMQV